MEVIKEVGLLDELFFMYGEEADFCWRMYFKGYRLVYVPASVVYHYGSGTMGGPSPRKIFLHHRNGLILLLKNYTALELVKYLPFRIFLDFVAFWYYILSNRLPTNALAVAKAYLDLAHLMPAIIKRRLDAPYKRKKKNIKNYPLYKKSVIVDYFIYRKKKFSQLNFYPYE